jgi:predicted acylesterase/phospholipase RssA
MIPKIIYLSGGGICGVAHVGALRELSHTIPLHLVKEWFGVSAGALMAMCIAIGFTLDELLAFSLRFNFEEILQPDTIHGWLLYGGLDTGERLYRLITACLKVKGYSPTLTFHELEQTGKTLRILSTDLTSRTGVCYHPSLTPNYPVADAVRSSMTYPLLFQAMPCSVTGHLMSDGGIISNYPMYYLRKEDHPHTLAILLWVQQEQPWEEKEEQQQTQPQTQPQTQQQQQQQQTQRERKRKTKNQKNQKNQKNKAYRPVPWTIFFGP